MIPVDNPPFGMIIVLLSAVFKIVLKICISFTVPDCPCASMKSPTLYGLNSKTITPPAKFCSVPLNAIPTANPAEANTATNDVVSIPNIPIMMTIKNNVSVMLIALNRNVRRDNSTFLFSRMRNTILCSRFISHLPTKKITKAMVILIVSSIAPDTIFSKTCSNDICDNCDMISFRFDAIESFAIEGIADKIVLNVAINVCVSALCSLVSDFIYKYTCLCENICNVFAEKMQKSKMKNKGN